MNHIYVGKATDCLRHLRSATRTDHYRKRQALASFVGVSSETVGEWLTNGVLPRGETLIRLYAYLEWLGYRIAEISRLDPATRGIIDLVAFRVCSLKEVAADLGYLSDDPNDQSSLLGVLRGVRGTSPEKLRKMGLLVASASATVEDRKGEATKIELDLNAASSPQTMAADVRRPGSQNGRAEDHSAMIDSLAGQISAMTPLVTAISSDGFTAGERAKVRELSGGDGVFKLANLLFRLCGERTRHIHSTSTPTTTNDRI